MQPDMGALGSWNRSWVQPGGQIHGFHNHTVWGGNPYRWLGFTSGHSTWASPFFAALARALATRPDARGLELLRRLLTFQTGAFQADGNYAHIGFQVGESLKFGLIHNAITNVSLCQTGLLAREQLGGELLDPIGDAFLRNVANRSRPDANGTCNQEYARIWSRLLFQELFDDRQFYDELPEDIDFMLSHFHVAGVPGAECEGTLRQLCRQVVRSSWVDAAGNRRFHRLWHGGPGTWRRIRTPMLISGMGDTLEGIQSCHERTGDEELGAFVGECDRTYAVYQHPAGFFVPATGWQSEVDVAPSSAWHAHDLRSLVRRFEPSAGFWDAFFRPYRRTAVLLGDQCLWVERDHHWAILDYLTQDVFSLAGRKDEPRFGRDMGWVGGERALPLHVPFPKAPKFLKADEEIRLIDGGGGETDVGMDVRSIASVPYRGEAPPAP